jgi:hypothetical protein
VFGKPAVLVGLRWSVLPVNDNIFCDDRYGHFAALGASLDRPAIWSPSGKKLTPSDALQMLLERAKTQRFR